MTRKMKMLLAGTVFLLCMIGAYYPAYGAQSEKEMINEWISKSITEISQKVKAISAENSDPFFVPAVLLGPIVTRTLPQTEFYESQLSLLLRDSIYLKLAAGLSPTPMNIVDIDILSKAVEASALPSVSSLNAVEISATYSSDPAMRSCIKSLLAKADILVLGQITLKDKEALTTFTMLTLKNGKLYLDRTPISIQTMPGSLHADISINVGKDGVDRMMRFVVTTDEAIQRSVQGFVQRFAESWEKGDVKKVMSFYDKDASAVTLTLGQNSRVKLTNVLNRASLELVMAEFFERYNVTNFDFSSPRVYDTKWNSKNVASCSVDFDADITLADGKVQRLPLLSFYMQLRRKGAGDWKIYFQRIKEVPKYSVQLF